MSPEFDMGLAYFALCVLTVYCVIVGKAYVDWRVLVKNDLSWLVPLVAVNIAFAPTIVVGLTIFPA